jgi:ubiquinone/menaquinone biosynthesis C-methylase UbiE
VRHGFTAILRATATVALLTLRITSRASHPINSSLDRHIRHANTVGMTTDPKIIVAEGYDKIAEAYVERFGISSVRQFWLDELIARLSVGASVLDLGCGAGLPVARDLRRRDFAVTGIDGSRRQIELARRNVPAAEFIQADMISAEFASASFDAVSLTSARKSSVKNSQKF